MRPALLLFLLACETTDKTQETATPPDDSGGEETGSTETPPTLATEPCEAILSGAPGEEDPVLELSRAHGAVRLFGPAATWEEADLALIDALEGETWDPEATLEPYAPLVGACVLDGRDSDVPDAFVTSEGTTAIVHPGLGAVEIPEDATAIVLDLRGYPAGAEAADALEETLATVLSGEQELGEAKQRRFLGFPGALSGRGGTYGASLSTASWTVSGAAVESLPLIVWTEARLSPDAARVAGALRLDGRAWLVGHPVWAAAAEASWAPVGGRGLAWPARTMILDDEPWPDQVPADLETDLPEDHLEEVLAWDTPEALSPEAATRATMSRYTLEIEEDVDGSLTRGSARAMLMVAHGIIDRFFPYFEVVGYEHDDALLTELDTLDAAEEGDREAALHSLGRFMHVLQDGHGFFGDWVGTTWTDSYLALQVQLVGGEPIVSLSGHDEVQAGDTVISIDGVPADVYYADSMSWHSAATEGYLFEVSGRDWQNPDEPCILGLRGVDGEEREVTLEGLPFEEVNTLAPWAGSLKPSGWLEDLGADNLYYLNLSGYVTTTEEAWQEALAEGAEAEGLVVDMRAYPGVDPYAVAAALREGDFQSPTFRVRTWDGPEEESWDESSYALTGEALYTGPVALLVSNKTVSAAENFAMMLWGAENFTVVGEQSAGTNGNITATWLPGGYYFYFTGMEVLNPDGSTHHGRGIPLDVEVIPSPEDYAAGIDPEIQAAIEALGG